MRAASASWNACRASRAGCSARLAVGAASFALPRLELDAQQQGIALLAAMAIVTLFVIASVRDVILVMIDIAMVFEGVAARLDRLVRPMMAFITFYALLVVVFACLYRIADLTARDAAVLAACRAGADQLRRCAVLQRCHNYDAGVRRYRAGLAAGARASPAWRWCRVVLMLLFGFSEIMRSAGDGGAPHDRLTAIRVWPTLHDDGYGRPHDLARTQGSGHRWSGVPRLQSLPRAGAAWRARDGAGWVPVRRRRQSGEPCRRAGGTGARRYSRDRPAHRCARAPRLSSISPRRPATWAGRTIRWRISR